MALFGGLFLQMLGVTRAPCLFAISIFLCRSDFAARIRNVVVTVSCAM